VFVNGGGGYGSPLVECACVLEAERGALSGGEARRVRLGRVDGHHYLSGIHGAARARATLALLAAIWVEDSMVSSGVCVAISETSWDGLGLAVEFAGKEGEKGVHWYCFAMSRRSLGNKGTAAFAPAERGEVRGTRERVRGAGAVGHSVTLQPPSPAPASCSVKWPQENFF
jgi:hypothetical protein